MNFLAGIVDKGRSVVRLPEYGNHEIALSGLSQVPADGTNVTVGLRPGHFNATGPVALDLVVELVEHLGLETFVYARRGKGEVITIATQDGRGLKAGQPYAARFDPASALLFAADGGRIR